MLKNKVDFYRNRVLEKYSQKDPHTVTLKQLIIFGRQCQNIDKLLTSANYVREELPIRLAHRIRMFQQLPFIVGSNPHIGQVYIKYWAAFDVFRQVKEIKSMKENQEYCALVQQMLNQHENVVPYLVQGCHETQDIMDTTHLQKFMNETLQSRVSRRVLAEQHIALTSAFTSPTRSQNIIGIVNNNCNALSIVQKCALLCSTMFQKLFNKTAPKVLIDGMIDAKFVFIPRHIEFILLELINNSMTFTQKSHNLSEHFPPIHVTIGQADGRIMFRVSDKGTSSLCSY